MIGLEDWTHAGLNSDEYTAHSPAADPTSAIQWTRADVTGHATRDLYVINSARKIRLEKKHRLLQDTNNWLFSENEQLC